MLLFDKTITIKRQSKANETFVASLYKSGTEKQLYKVGQTVSGNGLGFKSGVIIDAYNDNGYVYYVVSYKVGRKEYTKTLRQTDINIIEL